MKSAYVFKHCKRFDLATGVGSGASFEAGLFPILGGDLVVKWLNFFL